MGGVAIPPPSPQRYYDVGRSAIVEWRGAADDCDGRRARRFFGLRDLALRLERESAVPPALLIFHCGRCGSTLMARLLELDPANRVFIEPPALSRFLHVNRARLGTPEARRELAVLLRAYGLEPTSGEKRLIFKLNSLAVHAFAALRGAVPDAAVIYMLRDPADVLASLARVAPAFLRRANRAWLAEIIGVDPAVAVEDSAEAWWNRYLAWNLGAAFERARDFSAAIDYRDYATRYLAVASRWSDRLLVAGDRAVSETLAFHSKRPGVRFTRDVDAIRPSVSTRAAAAYLRWSGQLEAAAIPSELDR